jgi:hypothetical protein
VNINNGGTITANSGVYLGGNWANPVGGAAVLNVNSGGTLISTTVNIAASGTLSGAGTIQANVQNGGLVSPGTSPGTLQVTGNYTQNSTGELRIELASLTSYDSLATTGSMALSGKLKVTYGGYVPAFNDKFQILDASNITGSFTTLDLQSPGNSLAWDTSHLYSDGNIRVVEAAPFWGTVWIDPDVIQPTDWSAHESLSYSGIAPRVVFDRRDNAWTTKQMHIFEATFGDGEAIEVRVNSNDYSIGVATTHAENYSGMVGQLPASLREYVHTMTIHDGDYAFGGGSNDILVHAGVPPSTVAFLEEILFHEATHVSYDADHHATAGWLAAQATDPTFISQYALDNPQREDVAESLLMWYSLKYRSDRLDGTTILATQEAIPNRLAYFDGLPFDMTAPDFNFNGQVDAADYVLWRNMSGSSAQFATWRANFGSPGPGSWEEPRIAVPEPAGFVLGVTSLAVVGIIGRRRDRL